MFWFKSSAEKPVSALLQSMLVCSSLIPLSSRYTILQLYALNVKHNDITLALELLLPLRLNQMLHYALFACLSSG